MQEQNKHLNTSFSSSVSFKRSHLVFNKGCKQIKKNEIKNTAENIVITLKSGNGKKFENLLALGR